MVLGLATSVFSLSPAIEMWGGAMNAALKGVAGEVNAGHRRLLLAWFCAALVPNTTLRICREGESLQAAGQIVDNASAL
jgi:hypothetical protein